MNYLGQGYESHWRGRGTEVILHLISPLFAISPLRCTTFNLSMSTELQKWAWKQPFIKNWSFVTISCNFINTHVDFLTKALLNIFASFKSPWGLTNVQCCLRWLNLIIYLDVGRDPRVTQRPEHDKMARMHLCKATVTTHFWQLYL